MKNSTKDLLDQIKTIATAKADPIRAVGAKAYMKQQFDFLGFDSKTRKDIIRSLSPSIKALTSDELLPLMKSLWHLEHREYQYIAVDIGVKHLRKWTAETLPTIEWLITHKSWWDTVDIIASNLLGQALSSDEEIKYSYAEKLINSEDLWLRRSAIIFQLKYKENADFDLLQSLIIHTINEKDFFIRKAHGWALRQYSKFNPARVSEFIDSYRSQLSPLAIKEGSKYL